MTTIDADAHVLESPATWEFMDPEFKKYTPMVVTQQSGETKLGNSGNVVGEYWVVDGRLHGKQSNMGIDTTQEAREMSDIQARIDHMKELEIDIQVLYPTLFLMPVTRKAEIEYALTLTVAHACREQVLLVGFPEQIELAERRRVGR